MKICFLAYEFPRSMRHAVVSGEVKNPYHLARGLVANGHDITVVSVPFLTRSVHAATMRSNAPFTIYDVPEGRLRSVARYALRVRNVNRFLAGQFPDGTFDIIHAHSPALAAAARTGPGGRDARTPIITTAHGTYVPESEGDRRVRFSAREIVRTLSGRFTLSIDRGGFRASRVVVAVSQFQEAEMVGLYRVPPANVEVIYNGVDLRLYRPDGPVAELALTRDDTVILFVGRLVPKKGLQHLIEAFPSILAEIPTAKCVVVGGSGSFDTFGPTLQEMARRHGVADRFVWMQDVPEAELPAIYRRASVAVFPSVNYESLPTVALESMACGVPVIATNRWGTPEALGASHPGLVAQADHAELARTVVALLTNRQVANAVKLDQHERVNAFSLDACVSRHEELYARVAAKK